MIFDTETVTRISQKIFEATVTQNWQETLAEISRFVRCEGTALYGSHLVSGEHKPEFILYDNGISPDSVAAYNNYYYKLCIRTQQFALAPPGKAIADYHFLPEAEINKSEYYDFLTKSGGKYGVGASLSRPGYRPSPLRGQYICCHFSPKQGHPEEEEIKRFSALLPALTMANQLWQILPNLQNRIAIYESMFNHVDKAILCLNQQREVIFINKKAQQILQQNESLSYKNKKLVFAKNDDKKYFHILLNQVIAPLTSAEYTNNSMTVHPYSTKRGLTIQAIPLEATNGVDMDTSITRETHIMIILKDMNEAVKIDEAHLAICFNLTPTEAKIAHGLAKGMNSQQIAAQNKLKKSTIDWHIKNIMAKMEASHRGELVMQLYMSLP